MRKTKKHTKARDLKPKKDAKGGTVGTEFGHHVIDRGSRVNTGNKVNTGQRVN